MVLEDPVMMARGKAFKQTDPTYVEKKRALKELSKRYYAQLTLPESLESHEMFKAIIAAARELDEYIAVWYVDQGVTDGRSVAMEGAIERVLAARTSSILDARTHQWTA